MSGEKSKNECYLWKPKEENKECMTCQFMAVLKGSKHTISRASELCLDPVEELQRLHAKKEETSHMFLDTKNFDRNMHILEDIVKEELKT